MITFGRIFFDSPFIYFVGGEIVEIKFTVIKNEDIESYMNDREKLILQELLYSINRKKKQEGKAVDQEYLIINRDETYAPKVIDILKANNHWDEGSDQEFLMDEDCVKVEFKGQSYTFTKLQDRDVSEGFNKPAGTVVLTHRIDGFNIPLYLLIDGEHSEFTFAYEALSEGSGKFLTLQDEGLKALAVELVVYANENSIKEQLPSEEEKTEIKPAEQSYDTSHLLSLENNQLLIHKKGKPYKVKDTDVYHSEQSDVPHILYKALYKTDKKKWVRPYSMFTSDRFAPISNWEYLQLKLGNNKTKEKLLSKKFGK